MKLYTINVHYDACISVSVVAENEERAKDLACYKADETPITDADVSYKDCCITDVEELSPIMNITNNHDKTLVDKINKAYYQKSEDFETIVRALMERDIDECLDKCIGQDIHSYLMQVADDNDLEIILKFLGEN